MPALTPQTLTLLLPAAALAAAVLAAVLLEWLSRGDRLRAWTLPAAWCALGVCAALGVVGGLAIGLDAFGVMHVLYAIGTISLPLLGVATVVLALHRGRSRPAIAVGAVMILPALVGVYATHLAPYQLRVDRASSELSDRRGGDSPIRVGVLADLQTTGVGSHEERAISELMAERPDVVLIAGDLFQGDDAMLRSEADDVRDLLGRLEAPGGVYLVRGDVDGHGRLDSIVPDGIRLLDDEVATVSVRDRRVRIGGTRLDVHSDAADRMREELTAGPSGDVRIQLSHRPDSVLELDRSADVDLTVAGHTHGGQVSLPVLGPPITLSAVPRSVGAGGLHLVRDNAIYVSTGVGMERGQAPQLRLGAAPSIGLVELTG